jgi:16S rRNA (cytosine967-C5)-methyltransferase
MGARETALNVLIACRKEAGWSNGVLKQYIARDRLDRRDAALATRLCYGVVQNRLKLDHYLKQLLTGKLKDLHPVVHDILHLGLYQILEMDRVPESAAVNESVDLAKKYCPKQRFAPGLVNGVLRSAVREKERLNPPAGWQEKYSHPQKLIDLLKSYVGKKMEKMLQANNETPETVVQVNTLRTTAAQLLAALEAEGVSVRPHDWMKNALVLSGTGNIENLTAFRDGLFYVQDTAAKLSVLCAEIPEDANVLDCCAAPGGKSFAAAMVLQGSGHITSCDFYAHKAELIAGGAKRLGLENLTARQQDATVHVPQWEEKMDVVICDVPCSGLGIIFKKPDIKYKSIENISNLPTVQYDILSNCAKYVKVGGILVYSTCTLSKEENENNMSKFLEENKNFVPVDFEIDSVKSNNGMYTFMPHINNTDGFFVAKIKREK